MRDKPNTLHELLRAALRTQVDLGVGEIIIDPARVNALAAETAAPSPTTPTAADGAVPPEQWVEGMDASVRRVSAPAADMFGNDEPDGPPEPEFSSLEEHCKAICDCRNCPLAESRTKFVYGTGNPNADLMFVGEAPGRDEDLKGEPFVGRAGQLLDKILAAMKLSRKDVYIANVLKCRPPNNRDPLPEEIAECLPHLKEQIRIIRPKVLCALGRIAGQALLDTKTPLGRLRKHWHTYEGVPLLMTYHPAALLRFPQYKKDTWEDMQLVMAKLEELQG